MPVDKKPAKDEKPFELTNPFAAPDTDEAKPDPKAADMESPAKKPTAPKA